ncbi:MAG: hypothetical protein IJ527_06860, partial [Prevotella sp.]|nr:hypothetical protein [Prevotella sp.]
RMAANIANKIFPVFIVVIFSSYNHITFHGANPFTKEQEIFVCLTFACNYAEWILGFTSLLSLYGTLPITD